MLHSRAAPTPGHGRKFPKWRTIGGSAVATLNIKSLPDDLHEKLKARAKRQRRSEAQEVISLLGAALDPPALSIMDLRGLGALAGC
ncbi:FitA-like ribbon-helix-helix domain-containing protein [Rhodopila sp.]|uniref:FitA-like ribbon-helix-helix domain-containing protein n=1 Tax=Rhodopila sp. TaxID=2480087 RepID=UPI003D0F47E1